MTRKGRTKMRMKTLWSIQEMKLKIPSGLFSLVAQYFDVSADVEVGAGVGVADAEAVVGVGVADVEAVDGVKAGNVKSRWMYLYLMYLPIYPPTHPFVFVCRSVSLFVYLSIHCFKYNLDNLQSVFLFAHLHNFVFTIFTSQATDRVGLFYHIYREVTTLFHKLVVSGSLNFAKNKVKQCGSMLTGCATCPGSTAILHCWKDDLPFFFLFFYSHLTVQSENGSLNIYFISSNVKHGRNRFIITLIFQICH